MSQPLRTFAFFKTNILSGCVLEGVELSTSLTGLDTGGDEQGGSAGTGDADGSRAGKADFFFKATRDNCLKIDDDFFDLLVSKDESLADDEPGLGDDNFGPSNRTIRRERTGSR